MAATADSTSSFLSLGRSLRRLDQIHAVNPDDNLAAFQHQVAHLLHQLNHADSGLLSINWISKLLNSLLIIQEDFRIHISKHQNHGSLLNRLASDFFTQSVRFLDILNAIRAGIDQLRIWRSHLYIVLAAVGSPARPGQGQLRRANKALTDLAVRFHDGEPAHRNRSFCRAGVSAIPSRSLSWSVSRSWSAARQLQAIAANLTPPRGQEIAATHGLADLFYTMSSVTLFVSWVLVAAIPCQDRGIQVSFAFPRSYAWAGAMMSIHDRIVEESKRRERRQTSGLLSEIQQTEKCVRRLMELIGKGEFPLEAEAEVEEVQDVGTKREERFLWNSKFVKNNKINKTATHCTSILGGAGTNEEGEGALQNK